MIGTSDGEQYEDSFAHTIATIGLGATEKPAGALNEGGSYPGSGEMSDTPKQVLSQYAMDEHLPRYNPSDALQPLQNVGGGTLAAPHETIVAPAVRSIRGEIFKGKDNHTQAFQAASDAGMKRGDLDTNTFGGFVTSTGKYLNRSEAYSLAKENGQFIKGSESRGPLDQMLMSHQVDWDLGNRHQRLLELFQKK